MPAVKDEYPWEQYFPTYRFSQRDIALREYDSVSRVFESEERLFTNSGNIAVIAGSALGYLAIGGLDIILKNFQRVIPEPVLLFFIVASFVFIHFITIKYFADRQKSIVYAARKMVVLRRMLGLTYGSVRIVLPNWRLEGADEPFAIHPFPGWTSYACFPFHLFTLVCAAVIFLVLTRFIDAATRMQWLDFHWVPFQPFEPLWAISLGVTFLWVVTSASIYRGALFDYHESWWLVVCKVTARMVGVRLVSNFEYVIYRAVLSRYETARLGVDLTTLGRMAVFLEDRQFYRHCGVSLRGVARAMLGVVGLRPRSGGSTISQQLVRSIFIYATTRRFRRKFIEMGLALWLDAMMTKDDILAMYLSCVRFEREVYGVVSAMRHYFAGNVYRNISTAKAFVLIERVANVQSSLLGRKVAENLLWASREGILQKRDLIRVIATYQRAIRVGTIKDEAGRGMQVLRTVLDKI